MGIYLITHKYRLLNQEIRNTFYYTTTVGEPSAGEFQDMADEIRADFVSELQASVSAALTLYGMDYRRVDIAGLLTFSLTFTAGDVVGGSANDPLPTQVAMVVSNKGTTTKPNRARTYLAGFIETSTTAGLFNTSYLGAATDFIDLQSNLNGGGTNPLSRVAAQWNTSHTQVIASNDLSGAASVASAVPGTQRRRRIGVGI